jgi:hypothetical protein
MNKFAKTLCMMAVVVLAFTSCKKNNQDVKSIAFNGSFEQFQVEESAFNRAYIDADFNTCLEEGDSLMIFNIYAANPSSSQAATFEMGTGTQLNFVSGDDLTSPTTGYYYAFYPAGNVTLNLSDQNKAVFRLDDTQYYREDNNGNPMIPKDALYMAAKDPTNNQDGDHAYFDMKNICGVLAVRLYSASGRTITAIHVADSAFNLVGDVTLKIDKVNPSEMTTLFYNYDNSQYQQELATYINEVGYSVENKGNTVTLDLGAGVTLSQSYDNPSVFYIVLRPLALKTRSSITVDFKDGSSLTIPSNASNIIKPNVVRILDPIQVG